MSKITDKELIDLAAKAYVDKCWHDDVAYMQAFLSKWNPLTDDGDALRLAVSLGLIVGVDHEYGQTTVDYTSNYEDRYVIEVHGLDTASATRRAITMAAAQIGKEMQ